MARYREGSKVEKTCLWCVWAFVLGVLTFGPLALGGVLHWDFALLEGMGTIALGLWLVWLWSAEKPTLFWPPLAWGVLLFVVYAFWRYETSSVEYVSRQAWIRVLFCGLLFALISNLLSRSFQARWTVYILVGLGMLISAYALYQFLAHSNKVWWYVRPASYFGRGSGTYICPNHLAGFLEMLLPLGLAFLFLGRMKSLPRVLMGYASLVIFVGIMVTLSRGGWVATLGSLLVFFAVYLKKSRFRWAAGGVLILMVGAGFEFIMKDFFAHRRVIESLTPGTISDVSVRFWLWGSAWRMWMDHVWLGVGPGLFHTWFPRYRPPVLQLETIYAHNDYLNGLDNWGLIGAVLLAVCGWLFVTSLRKTWRRLPRSSGSTAAASDRLALVLGGSAGICAITIHSFFDFNLHIPANAILASAIVALVAGQSRSVSESHDYSLGLLGKLGVSVVLAGAVFYLGAQSWQGARAGFWELKGLTESRSGEAELEDFVRAARIEPGNPELAYRIGEIYRSWSWRGHENYREQAQKALVWYGRAMKLNAYESYYYLRYGMCLDWLGRHEQATRYFARAVKLDPNYYYTQAYCGWHYYQLRDYQKAKRWLQGSLHLKRWGNPIASIYLERTKEKLGSGGR